MTSGDFAFDFNSAGPQSAAPAPANDQAANARRVEALRLTLPGYAESIVRHLFPLARIERGEARIGDVDGNRGESLSVELSGDKAGQWIDHGTGGMDRGDLFTLWQAATRCTFSEAVDDLEGFTGTAVWVPPASRQRFERVKAERVNAAEKAGPEPRKVKGAEWSYLAADGSRELAHVVRYDLVDEAGEVVGKTFAQRGEDPAIWKAPASNRPLYNLPGIVSEPVVVLVEGEKCADALAALGVAATSALGGSGAPVDLTDWSPLRGKRVILWPDNDGPGPTEARSFVGQKFMERVRLHLAGLGIPCAVLPVPPGKPAKWDAANADPAEAVGLLRAALAQLDAMPAAANAPDRKRLLRLSDMRSRPAPRWLIQGMIPERSYSVVVGDSETMKSFAAIGWAVSIAYGRGEWLGRAVKSGAVVYVAGEGQSGLLKRLEAHVDRWSLAAKGDGDLYLYDEAVDMPGGNVEPLLTAIREDVRGAPVQLVVLDTLAQCFGAGDENAQADMNAFNNAVKRLQAGTGAAVLAIHHLNRMGGARGSTNLRAALDTMILMEREGRTLVLRNQGEPTTTKQKDAAPFDDIHLTYDVVSLGFNEDGDPVSSVVLRLREGAEAGGDDGDGEGAGAAPERPAEPVGPLKRAIFRLIKSHPEGLRRAAILQELKRGKVRSGDPAVDKAMREMRVAGFIEHTDDAAKVWTVRKGETGEPDG